MERREPLKGCGLPSMACTPDGEGRISTMAAATGQNPVTATSYNTSSHVTGMTLGSADSDAFAFEANTVCGDTTSSAEYSLTHRPPTYWVGPYGVDPSATVEVPAGYGALCKGF